MNEVSSSLKIALISDVPPESSFSGGQVLQRVTENSSNFIFHLFLLDQFRIGPNWALGTNVVLEKYFDLSPKVAKKNWLSQQLIRFFYKASRLALNFINAIKNGFSISRAIRIGNYDYIWMVLEGELLCLTFLIIAWRCKTPIILHQWDPISWWSSNRGHGKAWGYVFERLTSLIEKKAFINLIPSEQWKHKLELEGKRSHKIDNFFTLLELNSIPYSRNGGKDEIHAVFLGQTYSNRELESILLHLHRYSSKNNKKTFIHYYGGAEPRSSFPNVEIVNNGFVKRTDLLVEIGKWDFALLPYPMQTKYKSASRYSFPSKSRIYVAAGLPILSLCARDSTPQQFFNLNYHDFFHNIAISEEIGPFIEKCVDRSSQSTNHRFACARQLLAYKFSLESELLPLQKILVENKKMPKKKHLLRP